MRLAVARLGGLLLLLHCFVASAQDTRAQYPRLLSNSYFGIQIGYIDYPFSNAQLEQGLKAASIDVPHLAVRVLLLGHEFNKHFSAQASYMRPAKWVEYQNVNGDSVGHSVWMNVAGLTAKSQLPVTKTLSVYGEGGLGIVTRKGFEINHSAAVKDANYATLLLGGGLQYHVGGNWSLVAGITTTPADGRTRQPRTSSYSTGFNYTMRPLSTEEVERNSNPRFVFPKNLVQLGYATDVLGYGVNDFFSRGALPIFWAADVHAAHGLFVSYQRSVFHTRRIFSLNWGAGLSSLKSKRNGEEFQSASLYPVLRFTVMRMQPVDVYVNYSLAGPTFISKTMIDGQETGRRFTFQDFMGVGLFSGRNRNLNAEIRIAHFSNGNLFPRNAGVTVPVGFNVGYAF